MAVRHPLPRIIRPAVGPGHRLHDDDGGRLGRVADARFVVAYSPALDGNGQE
ncbi:hypothetical protein [Arthrobacter sp. ISL-65]|uniref:hypothetical protein n=1 Tax=Arthrobacter sp. ISL-65 TaxID=2819112 RepID=UPI001BEC79A6|nr:hypothetical protein [Arthrobacter sp. ISL-65]MBT2551246.1 hypothetical protein [Arthrobacter sp. ISL-65]